MVYLNYGFPCSEVNIAANTLMSFRIFHYYFVRVLGVLKELNVQWLKVLGRSRWKKDRFYTKVEFLNANTFTYLATQFVEHKISCCATKTLTDLIKVFTG